MGAHLGSRSGADDLRLCQGTLYDGVIDDLGFDAADVKAQTDGWVQTMKELQAAVIAAGGWSWAWCVHHSNTALLCYLAWS